jgi:hypothetical protein
VILPELQFVIVVAATPLNLTTLLPCNDPKFAPLMTTGVPGPPVLGDRPLMEGAPTTVKVTPGLENPPCETTTGPLVALPGTAARMTESPQLTTVAGTPLKVIVPVPCGDPKCEPLTVTCVFVGPVAGDKEPITGVGMNVNGEPLLAKPPTVTTTLPVDAPLGTGTTILLTPQLVGVPAVPLKVTVLVPCGDPKVFPLIVTAVPNIPEVGERFVMLGGTVKLTPLLATPPAATTKTLPVVAATGTATVILEAPQFVGLAAIPLKVTVPWLDPKFVPEIVTVAPTAPVVGKRVLMLGAGVTVKGTPALAIPPAAVTTTLPVVVPVATVATILVALQLVIVSVFPLNLTEPFP